MWPRHMGSPFDPCSSQIRATKDSETCFPDATAGPDPTFRCRSRCVLRLAGDSLVTADRARGSHQGAPQRTPRQSDRGSGRVFGKFGWRGNRRFGNCESRRQSTERPAIFTPAPLHPVRGSVGTGDAFRTSARRRARGPERARTGDTGRRRHPYDRGERGAT